MPGCYEVCTHVGCTVLKGQILLKKYLSLFFCSRKRVEGEVQNGENGEFFVLLLLMVMKTMTFQRVAWLTGMITIQKQQRDYYNIILSHKKEVKSIMADSRYGSVKSYSHHDGKTLFRCKKEHLPQFLLQEEETPPGEF